jgi:hypothetical protein
LQKQRTSALQKIEVGRRIELDDWAKERYEKSG